ncbi:hypothetical protein PG985_009610 [Apiospora marii]|uniref:uncharacterized protein n=1 Tax=Apiospora marii TaxID=335849 RepID=UPI00312E982D
MQCADSSPAVLGCNERRVGGSMQFGREHVLMQDDTRIFKEATVNTGRGNIVPLTPPHNRPQFVDPGFVHVWQRVGIAQECLPVVQIGGFRQVFVHKEARTQGISRRLKIRDAFHVLTIAVAFEDPEASQFDACQAGEPLRVQYKRQAVEEVPGQTPSGLAIRSQLQVGRGIMDKVPFVVRNGLEAELPHGGEELGGTLADVRLFADLVQRGEVQGDDILHTPEDLPGAPVDLAEVIFAKVSPNESPSQRSYMKGQLRALGHETEKRTLSRDQIARAVLLGTRPKSRP